MYRGIVALLLLSIVSATSIDNGLTTAVMDGEIVHVTSKYTLTNGNDEGLRIRVPSDVVSVKADFDNREIACSLENSIAYCGETKSSEQVFTINYATESVIKQLGNKVVFKFDEELPFRALEHSFVLKLPIGSVIPEGSDFFLTPKPDQIVSDGRRIMIVWKASNASSISVSAVTEQIPANFVPILLVVLLAAFAGAFISWRFLSARKKKKVKKQKKLVPAFVENEKIIVDLLKKALNSELWQKQLLKDSGFSKAKLSRLVRNLEQRGVVAKTVYGNTNKISLKR